MTSLDIHAQSSLIGALMTIAVVAGMLLRRRRRRSDVLFSIFASNLVLWFIANFVAGITESEAWVRSELAIAALIPATILTLYMDLLRGVPATARRLAKWAYPLSAVFVLIGASPLGEYLVVQILVGAQVTTLTLLTARVMMQSTAVAHGTVEWVRLRYLAIGAVATVTLTALGRIPSVWGDNEAAMQAVNITLAIGDLAVMLYVFFLSQVILRERLLDLHEFFGRMLVLGILTLLFASIFGALVNFMPATEPARWFNTFVSVIIVLTLYEPLRERLEAKSIEMFFRERQGLPHLLDQLRRTMLRVLDPSRMSKLVLDTLYDERRCTHAAVYLLDESGGRGFRLDAYRGPEPVQRINGRELPALWHAIQRNRAPLLAEQMLRAQQERAEPAKQDVIDAMRQVSADVLLPFISSDRVLGFLALRDDRVLEPYSTEEIALLMNIADTAVTVIENSQLARRLRERDRLAAIGEMAAGLAHEIRNPLGAIKGAAQYLEPNPERGEEAEFLQVIIDESNRLNGVVSQFLDYARPFRAKFSPTDVNEVVMKTAKLIEAKDDPRKIPLELELDQELRKVDVDPEQIKQVILNLVLNAMEAGADSDKPVKLSTRHVAERERVEIRVRDHGHGIPRDALEHIFVPFFTTKPQGTGLGLAVCQRIITNHGGDIRVQSHRNEGTEFIIRLPLRQKVDGSTTGSFTNTLPARATAALPPPLEPAAAVESSDPEPASS